MIATLAGCAWGIAAAGAATCRYWQYRPARLVDVATVTLVDTAENQAADPQSTSRKVGLCFTLARMRVPAPFQPLSSMKRPLAHPEV